MTKYLLGFLVCLVVGVGAFLWGHRTMAAAGPWAEVGILYAIAALCVAMGLICLYGVRMFVAAERQTGGRRSVVDADRILESTSNATVRAVNMVILRALRQEVREVVVRESEYLEGQHQFREAGGEVRFSQFVNRIKVLAELHPQTYAEPVTGQFHVKAMDRVAKVTVHIDDQADDSYVRLVIEDCDGEES